MGKVPTYEKPAVELEYDARALRKGGCCRLVPCVLRLCGIAENTNVTVELERVARTGEDAACFTYEQHPSAEQFRVQDVVQQKRYREYACALLARPFESDTGTITITVASSSSVLTECVILFDSRKQSPVCVFRKGRLKAYRALPRLRSREERAVLNGEFSDITAIVMRQNQRMCEDVIRGQDAHMLPLFT